MAMKWAKAVNMQSVKSVKGTSFPTWAQMPKDAGFKKANANVGKKPVKTPGMKATRMTTANVLTE